MSVEIRAANSGLGITGGVGSGVTSNVTDPNDPNRSLSIAFEHDKDSLVEADFLAMVGQKIEVGNCYSSPCAMKSDFYYKLSSSLSIGSDASNNPLPNYYIKVTAAAYHSTVQQFPSPIKRYLVEGEFELLLKQFPNDPIQAATNGKFRLLFSDNTY